MVPSLIDNEKQAASAIKAYQRKLRPLYVTIPGAGEAPLLMACFAAFPIAINTELLYQLWANFKQVTDKNGVRHDLPVLVVNDCLLSPLWRETSNGIFELQSDTRALLLKSLRERFDGELVKDLASFLFRFVQYKKGSSVLRNYYDAQAWTAMLAINPQQAAVTIIGSLTSALSDKSVFPSIGVSNLIATLVKDNQGFAEIMHNALAEKNKPQIAGVAPTATTTGLQKTLVIKQGTSGQAIDIELPEAVAARLMPLYKSKSVKTFPQQTAPAGKNRTVYALTVGCTRRNAGENSAAIQKDAEDFANMLENVNLILPGNNYILLGEQATYHHVYTQLQKIIGEADQDDTVLFYFRGEGVLSAGVPHLLFYDTAINLGSVPIAPNAPREMMPGVSGVFENENAAKNSMQRATSSLNPELMRGMLKVFKNNNPNIVILLDAPYTGSREWLEVANPKHFVITSCLGNQSNPDFPGMTDLLRRVFRHSQQNPTYKSIYSQLVQGLTAQIPVMTVNSNCWDNYFLTAAKDPTVLAEQRLLSSLGYPLFVDGTDHDDYKNAKADFENKFSIGRNVPIQPELQKALQLKDKKELAIFYVHIDNGENTVSAIINTATTNIQELWKSFRGNMKFLVLSANEMASQGDPYMALTKEIKQHDVLFIGLNNQWTVNPQTIEGIEIILDLARACSKPVYCILEEACEWLKPTANDYVVIPRTFKPMTDEEGLNDIYQQVSDIAANFEKYLQPVYTADNDPVIIEVIRQAVKTKVLDLSRRSLTVIPRAVFDIKGLRSLNLSGNQLQTIPATIGQLATLEGLDISASPVTLLPEEIGNMRLLRQLDCSNTSLEALPRSLQKLTALKTLRVQNSPVRVLDRAIFLPLSLEDFDAPTTDLLNFVPGNSDFMITNLDVKAAFSSGVKQDYSIIEIHSELSRPHFDTIPDTIRDHVHYAFYSFVETLPKLFSLICNNLSAKNNIIYFCDEKNILAPQFSNGDKKETWIQQYFKAFNAPLTVIINNPVFQLPAMKSLTEAGDLNMVAVRNDQAVTGDGFAETYFKEIWKIEKIAAFKRVFISFSSSIQPADRALLIDAVQKANYETFSDRENILAGELIEKEIDVAVKDWSDIGLFIVDNADPSIPSLANPQLSYEVRREITMVRDAKKPLLYFEKRTNDVFSNAAFANFFGGRKENELLEPYQQTTDLISKVLRALAEINRPETKRVQQSAVLRTIDTLYKDRPSGYSTFIGHNKFVDFSFPITQDEIKHYQPPITVVTSDNSPTTIPFNNQWILVVGTGDDSMTEAERNVSRRLGEQLAAQGYGLITGGWPAVDETVFRAFAESLKIHQRAEKDSILEVVTENQRVNYRTEQMVTVKDDNAWYEYTVQKAFAVIMIGGRGGTYDTYKKARDLQVPVIPVPATSGDALTAYRELTNEKEYFYAITKLVDLPSGLSDPTAIDNTVNGILNILQDCENNERQKKIFDFRKLVDSMYKITPVTVKDDLQKNRWGGEAETDGKELTASVVKRGASSFDVTLKVSAANSERKLTGEVAFFLHDTFEDKEIMYATTVNGSASITFRSYESFTVGAFTEQDGTRLELDLNEQPGYPPDFYYPTVPEDFNQRIQTLYKSTAVLVKDDLQKDRWGGREENNGKKLSATVRRIAQRSFEVTITITAYDKKIPFSGSVAFFLHDSFKEREIMYAVVVDGTARIEVNAYEAFTVGAYTEDGTMLELDLEEQDDYPEDFYYSDSGTEKTGFYTKHGIHTLVNSEAAPNKVTGSLQMLNDLNQHSWLVVTGINTYLIIDMPRTRKQNTVIHRVFPKNKTLPVKMRNAVPPENKYLVQFGGGGDWYEYSVLLFSSPRKLETAVRNLLR